MTASFAGIFHLQEFGTSRKPAAIAARSLHVLHGRRENGGAAWDDWI